MAVDTQLLLGDFEFTGFEVPEFIKFGGEQAMHVHKLLGGARIIDAMGPDDGNVSWSGRFQSTDASLRASSLDQMRRDGLPVQLSWRDNSFLVVIKQVEFQWERFYQCTYTIECAVVQDLAKQNADSSPITIDDQVDEDLQSQYDALQEDSNIAGSVNIASSSAGFPSASQILSLPARGINAVLSPVRDLVGGLQSIESATLGQVQGVLSAVNNARATYQGARNAVELIVNQKYGGGFAGINAGVSALTAAQSLNGSLLATSQMMTLTQMDSSMGRIGANLSTTGN